ncbi:hypothetical protein FQR65_LT05966 [Abscondita terminalis]|nr:hypothetical protein FQR65_LT05966 [Abscondita terminalis]
MKLFVILSVIVAAVAAVPAGNVITVREALGLSSKIISGQPAAAGQFPWQALNQFQTSAGSFICGGALIHPRWVLTAAHCADGAYSFRITLGTLRADGNIESHARVITTNTAIVHQNYNPSYLWNDVALVDLKVEVALSAYIQLVAVGTDQIGSGVGVTVSGWGKTSDNGGTSSSLNYVNLVTITNQQCAQVYGSSINDGSLCCQGFPQHSTCSGDSGGPLVYWNGNYVQHVGVVSFVHRSGCASGNPSGYARTSYYRSWIYGRIGKN